MWNREEVSIPILVSVRARVDLVYALYIPQRCIVVIRLLNRNLPILSAHHDLRDMLSFSEYAIIIRSDDGEQ